MSERTAFKNNIIRKGSRTTAVMLATGLLISSCGPESNEDIRGVLGMDPRARVAYDLAGEPYFNSAGFSNEYSGNKCLEDSPYDPVTRKEISANVTTETEDGKLVISVEPARGVYPNLGVLKLTGIEDSDYQLAGYDEASTKILLDNGCIDK